MSLAVSHPIRDVESAFLESLRPRYEREGYTFVVHPHPSDLPDFLGRYTPDAVASKSGQNIAIEVKSEAARSPQNSVQAIRAIFEGRPDWRFTIVYMGSDPLHLQEMPVADREAILARAGEARQLAEGGHLRAAFLVAWSLLEAALNSVRPDADKRPRSPGTVVQALAMYGAIPIEIELPLHSLVRLRNRVAHGDVQAEPRREDVDLVLSAVLAALETPVDQARD